MKPHSDVISSLCKSTLAFAWNHTVGQPPLRTPGCIFVDWFYFCVEISSLRSFRLLYTPTESALLLLTLEKTLFGGGGLGLTLNSVWEQKKKLTVTLFLDTLGFWIFNTFQFNFIFISKSQQQLPRGALDCKLAIIQRNPKPQSQGSVA